MRNHLFLLTAIMFALSGAASLYAEEDNIPKEVPIASNPTKEGVFRSPGIAAITCYFLEGDYTTEYLMMNWGNYGEYDDGYYGTYPSDTWTIDNMEYKYGKTINYNFR